ncbi:MAG: universal stress protein [Proteobacteria bacterium]|nr:universal stress protein [Pseudomonadota bacterium]MBU1546536.1 universal stress protein [Pseudomonadota bacterium]MBU2619497.1 universal stress protein [Pseudomonadota bacterium]
METAQTQMVSFVERILLATDCSPFSEGAEQEAIFFAQACGAVLTILHVIEANPEFSTIGHETALEMEESARDHLEKIQRMATNEEIKAEIVIRHSDDPVEVINEEVLTRNIDIVITGRRGRRGIKKILMGVVTEKVASMVPCKTLIVPKDFVIAGDGVLLATDGSSFSENAEKEAISMVSRCDYLKYICVVSAAATAAELDEAKQRVQRITTRIQAENKKITIETVAEIGSPSDMIVREAREKKVDVIIMGSHGRTGLQRLLMGSVCSELIASAPCSVLITK